MAFLFKKNNNIGSTVLIVVLVMSVLSICCMTFWQKSILFFDASIKRLEYEKKYRAASCGLEYAISVCANNRNLFDFIARDISNSSSVGTFDRDIEAKTIGKSDQNSYFMETEEFEISENIKYKCKIYISKNGEKVLNLRSVLLDMLDKKVFEVSCDLLKKEPSDSTEIKNKNIKNLIINNWKVCDQ